MTENKVEGFEYETLGALGSNLPKGNARKTKTRLPHAALLLGVAKVSDYPSFTRFTFEDGIQSLRLKSHQNKSKLGWELHFSECGE
jgi:hypothetical protein